MSALLPCPFCGTHPESGEHPSCLIQSGRDVQIECGKCGACWPPMTRKQANKFSEADLAKFWNRRAALSKANPPSTPPEGREQTP